MISFIQGFKLCFQNLKTFNFEILLKSISKCNENISKMKHMIKYFCSNENKMSHIPGANVLPTCTTHQMYLS